MGEKEILLTQEGYDNLEKELDYLKTEEKDEDLGQEPEGSKA